jgi:hypothetical protein
MSRGDWGGIVIHGRAIANCADCVNGQSCVSEGAAGQHCGNDDNDNSGTLRYVRIEYPGVVLAEGNELNCLTMNSVGRNTTIEYIQCHMGDDDTFEWFGGAARCRYLVSTGTADDNFDWQMGFRGSIQFGACLLFADIASAEKGIEADNNEFNNNAPFRSNPTLSNMTLVGRGPNAGVGTGSGINLRRGTAGTIINSIIIGFKAGGLDVDDAATYAAGCGTAPAIAKECDTFTSVGSGSASGFAARAYPNPATETAKIAFRLPASGPTRVEDEPMNAGDHEVSWNLPGSRAAGNYFFRVASGSHTEVGKIITLK